MKYLVILSILFLILIAVIFPPPATTKPPKVGGTLRAQLEGLTDAQKAELKATYIANQDFRGIFNISKYGITLEVISISKIEKGVEIFAKAWLNGEQLGFGSDGSVEIERFRIFNPPIMVPDGTFHEENRPFGGGTFLATNFKESPIEAIIETLAHTIKVSGKTGTQITPGKIGNTTSTFYPDAGKPGSTTVDGNPEHRGSASYSTAHDAADATHLDANNTNRLGVYNTVSGGLYYISRSLHTYDTSTIPDGDNIDSATLSLYAEVVDTSYIDSVSIVASTPASNNDYVLGDYDQFGTTKFATDKAYNTITVSAFNDFALNSSGLSNISKTGVSKFGHRSAEDIANTTATGAGYVLFNSTDLGGSTTDPTLVVNHSASATLSPDTSNFFMVF